MSIFKIYVAIYTRNKGQFFTSLQLPVFRRGFIAESVCRKVLVFDFESGKANGVTGLDKNAYRSVEGI